MQLKQIIIGSICLISSCVANADAYIWAAHDIDDGYIDWIHTESILNLDNGNTSFYIYSVNVNPELPYDLKVTELELRCKSREIKAIEAVTFLKGVKKKTDRFNDPWWRIRPHTRGDAWRKIICEKKVRDESYQQTYDTEVDLLIASQVTLRYFQKQEAEKKKNAASNQVKKSQPQPTTKPEPKKTEPKPVKKAPSELDLL